MVEGRIANFGIFLDVFEFCVLNDFFRFFKKIGFWGILCPTKHSVFQKKSGFLGIPCPPSYGIGGTIRIGQEMLCLPYAGFFFILITLSCLGIIFKMSCLIES